MFSAVVIGFLGNKIPTTEGRFSEVRVAMKPICDAIGIDISSELTRLEKFSAFDNAVETIEIGQSEGLCASRLATIELSTMNGWLGNIARHNNTKQINRKLLDTYIKESSALIGNRWREIFINRNCGLHTSRGDGQ